MRGIATWVTLAVLVVGAAGCPHRQTSSEPASEARDWYRKDNLFASFDLHAREVSLANAYLLELACFVGDKGTFEVDKTLAGWGFTRRRDFRDIQTSTYGYVASNERMVLVTFGGTDVLNVRDILSDVDALQLVYDERYCATPEARVHRGFRDSLNSVIDGVMDEVRRQAEVAPAPASVPTSAPSIAPSSAPTTGALDRAMARRARAIDSRDATPSPGKKLWVAGHSRGGAFAVLASAAFAKQAGLPEVAGVYTFGQPRVGNAAFARQLDAGEAAVPLVRFVNKDDPVANVPVATPGVVGRVGAGLDYQHAGVTVLLREDGRVVRSSEAEMVRRVPDVRAAGAAVGNHYQPAYQGAIYAAVANPELIEEEGWRAGVPVGVGRALPAPAK